MFFRKSRPANPGPVEFLVAGLGNPGKQYEGTRHNAGFAALEALAEKLDVRVDRIRFKSFCGEGRIGDKKVLLLMPQTFMNASGEAVRDAMQFYKLPPERCLILFDDISLPVGRLRVRAEGSAGGHNGLKSIVQELQSQAFPRVKVGVGGKPHPDYDLAAWVLGKFPAEDAKALADRCPDLEAAAKLIMDGKLGLAQSKYNG